MSELMFVAGVVIAVAVLSLGIYVHRFRGPVEGLRKHVADNCKTSEPETPHVNPDRVFRAGRRNIDSRDLPPYPVSSPLDMDRITKAEDRNAGSDLEGRTRLARALCSSWNPVIPPIKSVPRTFGTNTGRLSASEPPPLKSLEIDILPCP